MYITADDQVRIAKLIFEYIDIMQTSTSNTQRSDAIMHELFIKYFDKLIHGIIFNGRYRFWRFADVDDLAQEGRLAIITSIHKQQWKQERGSIFNFFSTVVAKNLINYTRKQSKATNNCANIDEIYNNKHVQYTQNYNKDILISETFNTLRAMFAGKNRFYKMIDLLEHYYEVNKGKKFVKKHFIEFAKAYNFSPASVNNLFAYLKRLRLKKEIKAILEIDV